MDKFIFDSEQRRFDLSYNPQAKKWMLDTTALQKYHLDKFKLAKTAKQCFAVNIFHVCSFDFRVLEDNSGNKAFITIMKASSGDGDLYTTDNVGFGYKDIVLYSTGRHFGMSPDETNNDFVFAKNLDGRWSILKLTTPGRKGFTDVATILTGCSSEQEALAQFKDSTGIDLTDSNVWTKVDQAFADRCVKEDLGGIGRI